MYSYSQVLLKITPVKVFSIFFSFYAVLRVRIILNHSGDHYGEATPVPIPNTAVKLSSADDTTLVTA